MKTIRKILMLWMQLSAMAVIAQPDTLIAPNTTLLGASWGANGGYATFGMAGQYVQGAIEGGNYTGRIGYLLGDLGQMEENLRPIAISPGVQTYYELGTFLNLEGYDPEGAPINFVITQQPQYGTLKQSTADPGHWKFTPKSGLQPDIVYEDVLKFKVKEVNTGILSTRATVNFKFVVEDVAHEVSGLSKSGSTLTVSFEDDVINANYLIDVNYYDLSDPTNPELVSVYNSTIASGDINFNGSKADYDFTVNQNNHNYLFSEDQVLVTVLVTTPNGYSSFDSYIVENNTNGRIFAANDGEYLVLGSEMSVPENKSVTVKMVAVDFAGFESTPTFEWTANPTKGTLSSLKKVKSNGNIHVWEARYTSTSDDGEDDNFEFRVYNPFRNAYKSAQVDVSIKEVNDAPVFSSIPDQQIDEEEERIVNLNYYDPDNQLDVSSSSSNENVSAIIENGNLKISATDDFYGSAIVSVWVEEVDTDESYLILKQLNVEVVPVNDAPVLSDVNDQIADEDETISVALEASDVDSDFQIFSYYSSIDNPLLATIEFSGDVMSIISKPNAFGTTTVTVVADDGSGATNALSNTVSFTVEFTAVNDDPELLQSPADQQLVENFPDYVIDLSLYFADAETESADLDYSTSGNTNIGINIVGDVATISSFTADYSGTESVTFTASDGAGGTDASFVIDFIVEEESLEITENVALGTIALDEDFEDYTLDVSTVFTSTETLTFQLIGNNLFTATVDNGNENIVFSSLENINGDEDLYLIASANGASKLHSFNISISPVNDAPVIVQIEDQSVNEDATLSELVIEVYDPDGDAISSFDAVSSDQALLLDENITYEQSSQYYILTMTPETDQNGSAVITASASDGTDDSSMDFELVVAAVNDLPKVSGSISDLDEDGSLSVNITNLFEDVDSESLTYEVESLPDWMDESNTTLTGTPSNDDVGEAEITVVATDEGGSTRATFEFEIVNVNDAPTKVQEAGTQTIFTNQSFSYDFPEGNFEDVDVDDQLTYTIVSKPSWLSKSNGTVSGTPTDDNVGSYKVVYKATDESGESVNDILYLEVEIQTYDATISFTNTSACEGETSSVQASGAYDYNWYDTDSNLLQSGGDTYETTVTMDLIAKGVDSQGIITDESFETSIKTYALPDASLTQDGDELAVAHVDGYSYEWFANESSISGASTATYEPEESGTYKVTITTDLGCTATSKGQKITILGVADLLPEIRLYPVPVQNLLTINIPRQMEINRLEIYNVQGVKVQSVHDFRNSEIVVDMQTFENGIYFLNVITVNEQHKFKFIKR